MQVLIVESNPDLAEVWRRHVERQCGSVTVAGSQDQAIAWLQSNHTDVILLDLMLESGSAFAVADFASYRQPEARVMFVTSTSFFSDGSIFNLVPNACCFFPTETPPEDLAAIVAHYGT